MKSAVETLGPTKVKITVEVPFEELQPSVADAYKKIAGTVAIPGFRKGKVPARLIDQRIGRGAVLEEAVNTSLPTFYSQAVTESQLVPLGQPEVEVTGFADGEQLSFTAEVEVRPEIALPDYDQLQVVVDPVVVADQDVETELELLRERFGVLTGVDRPAQDEDFLSLDLTATVGSEEVDSVSGVSYRVGSGTMLDGLDEAVRGSTAGSASTFSTTLAGGDHEGEQAEVAVVVKSVKERDLPALDDDFATMASEFDTLEELRADVRVRVSRMKALDQGVQARDRVLETVLAQAEVPVPEGLLTAEVVGRVHNLGHQLQEAGLSMDAYLAEKGQTQEEFDTELDTESREAIASQFVLDAVVEKEQIQVTQEELSQHIVLRAQRAGMSPDQFADQVVQAGQVQLLVAEVVRGKALALILSRATVTDTDGARVDLELLREDGPDDEPADPLPELDGGDEGEPDGTDAAELDQPADDAAAQDDGAARA